jgi:hypothetical protein
MHERSRERYEIHEKVRQITIERPGERYLQALKSKQNQPRNNRNEQNDNCQNSTDSSNSARTITPAKPSDNVSHRRKRYHENLQKHIYNNIEKSYLGVNMLSVK